MTTADIAGATNELFRGLRLVDVREVGRGATCTVYVARQSDLQRMIAIKHFNRPIADEKQRRRFERECQTLAGLQHPNILTLHSNGLDGDGRPYILMEYCPTGSLADVLTAKGPMAVPDVTRIGIKLSSALQLAHDQGVLHRDIKPANVLLTDLGEPKLADFGIAGDPGELSVTVGDSLTPLYAAPEVLEEGGGSRASDVWSLASTLYALLLGRAPYSATGTTGEGFLALLERIVRDPAPALGRSDVPTILQRALAAGMEKDPRNRVPTARDFAMTLQGVQFASGLPVTEYLESGAAPAQGAGWSAEDPAATVSGRAAENLTARKGAASGSLGDSYYGTDTVLPSAPPLATPLPASPVAQSRTGSRLTTRIAVYASVGAVLVAGAAIALVASQAHGSSTPTAPSPTTPVSVVAPPNTVLDTCEGLNCSLEVRGVTPVVGAQFHWQVGADFTTVTDATQDTVELPPLPGAGSYDVTLTETTKGNVILTAHSKINIHQYRRVIAVRRSSPRSLAAHLKSANAVCTHGVRAILQVHSPQGWRTEHVVQLSKQTKNVKITHSGRYRLHAPGASVSNAVCEAGTSRELTVRLPVAHQDPTISVLVPSTSTTSGGGQSSKPRNPVSPNQTSTSKPKDPVHP